MESLQELNAELLRLNTAIQRIIAGETLTEFEIGSGSSARRYRYGEVNLELLRKEKNLVISKIEALSETPAAFRKSSFMLTIHRKI